MSKFNVKSLVAIFFLLSGLINVPIKAQFSVDGDFKVRWYSDSFTQTLDSRDKENYMRYLGRIRTNFKVSSDISFHSELTTIFENNSNSVRNIVGTGNMYYTITQLFAELSTQDFLGLDLVRLRAGRQPFSVGSGLSFGESYYYLNKFDGARVDAAYAGFTFTLFGAITEQSLSEDELYPEPGSDQIYAARLSKEIFNQNVMGYYLLQRFRGLFNDNQVFGLGITGDFLNERLDYFGEFAYQKFNTAPGLPKQHGIGYMGGIGYRFSFGPFRSIKIETRYAAYQGDDPSTGDVEIFSPPYPSFFWGDRTGYANSEIGGSYPYNGKNPEGSKIWYSRIYVIPKILPALRIQLQYINVDEYADADGYNSEDDEVSLRFYYTLHTNAQIELRLSKGLPNGEDKDLNGSGTITSGEDRYSFFRIMGQLQISF